MIPGPYEYFVVKAFEYSAYVPILSTYTSLALMRMKIIELNSFTKRDYFGTFLCETSYKRFVVLLIPVFGNLVIAIYDFSTRKYNNYAYMISQIKENYNKFNEASFNLRSRSEFLIDAASADARVIDLFSYKLRKNPYFMSRAVLRNMECIKYCDHSVVGQLSLYAQFEKEIKYFEMASKYRMNPSQFGGISEKTPKAVFEKSISASPGVIGEIESYRLKSINHIAGEKEVQSFELTNLNPLILDVWKSEIETKFEFDDLDVLSRVSKSFREIYKSLYIKCVKSLLIQYIDDLKDMLTLRPGFPTNKYSQQYLDLKGKLEEIKSSELKKGFDPAVVQFTRAIEPNFRMATITRLMFLLKDVSILDINLPQEVRSLKIHYDNSRLVLNSIYTPLPKRIYNICIQKLFKTN
jgi:hypothetical protein